jgi:hypothetical protein
MLLRRRWAEAMCPLCLSAFGWLGVVGGAASLGALFIPFRQKGIEDGDDDGDASRRNP